MQGSCPSCGLSPLTSFAYNGSNPLLPSSMTDAKLTRTDYTYTANGRLETKTEAANVALLTRLTTYTYDANFPGLVTRVEVPSTSGGTNKRRTDSVFNATTGLMSSRTVEQISPVSGSTTYTYNEHCEQATETDARNIVATRDEEDFNMNFRSFANGPGLLCILSLSCASSAQQTRVEAVAPRDLSAIIAPLREKSQLPALGAAIVTSDGVEAIGAVGVRSWTGTERVTIDDQWHIGSCTKAMTATLAARLIDRGVLGWETTIGDVFGSTTDPAWKDVQIAWLLSHRSGAPVNFNEDLWERMVARGGSAREQRRFFVEEGLKTAPATKPNSGTVYSNSGYIVAGVMIEVLTDSSWEDLIRHEVFEPLGMTRTGFGAPGTPGRLDEPLGHTRAADGWSPVALGPNADNPEATGPAGTVHTTLSDWARFVAAHLRGERGDERYLKTATWQRLHSPGGVDWDYSPGWVVTEQEWAGGKLLRHIGSNNFWLAEATLAPRKDLAVLLVTNVSDDAVEAPFKELLAALIADHAAHAR